MDDNFNIYVDRLKEGHEQKIDVTVPSDFMDVHESDLAFNDEVHIVGKVFLSQSTLVLQLAISTLATMPCSICNEQTKVKINLPNLTFSEDIENIKGAIFSFKEYLRESILLEIPYATECNGSCPERANLAQYLKQ